MDTLLSNIVKAGRWGQCLQHCLQNQGHATTLGQRNRKGSRSQSTYCVPGTRLVSKQHHSYRTNHPASAPRKSIGADHPGCQELSHADMTVVTAYVLSPHTRGKQEEAHVCHSKIDAHPCRLPDFLTLLEILHHPVTCQCSSCSRGIHGPVGTERCSGLHTHAHECKHQHCRVHTCAQF